MKRFQINSDLSLSIKRRSQTSWLMLLIVFLPIVRAILVEFLLVPEAIDYVLDLVWIALLIYMLCDPRALRTKRVVPMLLWISLFFAYTLIVYLFRFQSPFYYLWGLRNNFRFYVAFIVFCVFMSSDEAKNYLKLMDRLFWINLVVTLVQYFMGYRFDFLGGIFGVNIGCNSFSNIFMMIVVTKALVFCFNKQEKLSLCLLKCLVALLIAALAEVKFFFIEFLFIAVLTFCMTRFSWRKVLLLVASSVGVLVGIVILTRLYPHFADAFIPKNLLEIASSDKGYTMQGDFNRLTAIACANAQFLFTSLDRMFGLGLGNCDTSAFAFLRTPFAQENSWTNYSWFSTSFIYLEMGYVGLVFFFGFFGLVYTCACMQQKKGNSVLYCQITKVLALSCVLLGIYNSSLRLEAGYMMYFALALPFMKDETIIKKEEQR